MAFPPTSTDPFRHIDPTTHKDTELEAEGFRMSFAAGGGSMYSIGVDLPEHAGPGPSFINFYASFYDKRQSQSIVETGISYSLRKDWNFFCNDGTAHPPEHRLGKACNGKHFDLTVEFTPAVHGRGQIIASLGGFTLRATRAHGAIDHMRLVIATGDRRQAFFSEIGMTLRSIDAKPPARAGFLEFMAGGTVKQQKDEHSVLIKSGPYGMRASLSPGPAGTH